MGARIEKKKLTVTQYQTEQDRSKPVNYETYQGGFVIVWTVYDRNKCFPCYNFVHK